MALVRTQNPLFLAEFLQKRVSNDGIINIFLVERMIRERWRIIKCTTKYGWLMAYYQGSRISQERMKILINLANKIGQRNCEIAVARIRKLSYEIHPNQIPIVAEAILNEIYTILILKQRREFRWEMKRLIPKPPTVFTISNDIF